MFEIFVGFIFSVFLGVLGLIVFAELAFSIRDWVISKGQELPEDSGDLVEPQFHLGATLPAGGRHVSLLRRRHYRHLELRPRGRWGYDIRWIRED